MTLYLLNRCHMPMEDGTEERLYFTVGKLPHSSLSKGQPIQLLFEQQDDGKTYRKLIG